MENIERNIIQEAAQGDQTAFHQIYQMTAGYVFALALKWRITIQKRKISPRKFT